MTTSETTPPELLGRKAGDVMVRLPKTLPIDTSVAQARARFTDDHVHMLLLTESGHLMGALVREDLRDDLDDDGLVLSHSRLSGRTVPAVAGQHPARPVD